MKIAIITSLIGFEGATIRDPSYRTWDVDYFAFVDRQHDCKVWKQLPAYKFSTDKNYQGRRNAKLAKVLGSLLLSDYDAYIWHDPYCEVVEPPINIVENFLCSSDICLFKHPERNCVYDEIEILRERNLDTQENLNATKQFLENNNYPKNAGLYELTSFAYRNSFEMKQCMLTWYELICRYSSRDQLTFPYALAKHNIKPNLFPGSALGYGGNNPIIPAIRWKTT